MHTFIKHIIIGVAAAFALTACSEDFLQEKLVSTITQEYLDTEEGLEQLIVANYNAFRFDRQYTESHFAHEGGSDLVTVDFYRDSYLGDAWQGNSTSWLSAAGAMGSYLGANSKGNIIGAYPEISYCNRAIETIRSGKALGKFATDKDYANRRLSESLVCRAWIYYELNTLFGDVFFSTAPYKSLPSNYAFPRTPAADMYKVLISDLRFAVEHLPESYSAAEFGRATKYTAAHLLSKMYLYRAQGSKYGTAEYGRNADGTIDNSNPKAYLGMLYKGEGTADLDSAIFYSSMVIEAHPLDPDYSDIFPSGALDDYSNENTSETVHNAVFGKGTDNYRYGCRLIKFGAAEYTGALKGIPTFVWQYGPGRDKNIRASYVPTDECFDLFDKINDSRFQKSFDVEYITADKPSSSSVPEANADYVAYNDPSNGTYEWSEDQAAYFNEHILADYRRPSWGGRTAVAGEHKMGTGDISQAFLENTKETAIDINEALAQPYVLYARWIKDGDKYYYRAPLMSGHTMSYDKTNFMQLENSGTEGIPTVRKYQDSNRATVTGEYTYRDINVMRSAEMYLVRAEANGRKGQYTKAIEDINVLRKRAAFKSGESRLDVIARLYPGHEALSDAEQRYPYKVEADTYEKIKVDASYWDGVSEHSRKENYQPQAKTELDRFVEFICNEYAREFCLEYRYIDEVHHAGVLAARVQWHKQVSANTANSTYAVGKWQSADNTIGSTGQTGLPKGGFQNFNTLMPFPSSYLNLLTDENGQLLTDAGKQAYQNYGYNF